MNRTRTAALMSAVFFTITSHAFPAWPQDTHTTEAEAEAEATETTPGTDNRHDTPVTHESEVSASQNEGRQRAAGIAAASFMAIPGLFVRGIEPGFWLEAGIARADSTTTGTARAMLGVTAALDPHFLTIGPVVDYTGGDGLAVGGGIDYLAAAPGLFTTFAALADPGQATILSGTVGWQIFAVDVQHHIQTDNPHTVVFFKLRAPISWIIRSLRSSRPHQPPAPAPEPAPPASTP
jgi:hypothetical protein